MKKTTFKISAFLLLTMFAFQAQAQGVTEIVETTKYTLQNIGTGQFLKANGGGQYEMAAATSPNDVTFNFFFGHHISIDPGADGELGTGDDITHDYPDDWNIQNDVRGIMRAANTGLVHTNFKYNQSYNPNGGHKTDKRWITETLVQGPFTTFRFSPLAGTDRYLYQAVDGTVLNITEADMTDEANDNTNGVASSYWVLVESDIVLSNEKFDASSIFISNPVNNELNIKGLTDNVSKVSVFNLLGSSVLTRNVAGQSSINLNVSALAAGMYIVKLEGDNGTFSKKIIKQ